MKEVRQINKWLLEKKEKAEQRIVKLNNGEQLITHGSDDDGYDEDDESLMVDQVKPI